MNTNLPRLALYESNPGLVKDVTPTFGWRSPRCPADASVRRRERPERLSDPICAVVYEVDSHDLTARSTAISVPHLFCRSNRRIDLDGDETRQLDASGVR
jgi:hypothetical protein